MRTRYKKYIDYGLNKSDVMKLFDYLNNSSDRDKEQIRILLCENLPCGISEFVYLALTEHRGYDYLTRCGLTYGKADFYGYKCKGLHLVDIFLKGTP